MKPCLNLQKSIDTIKSDAWMSSISPLYNDWSVQNVIQYILKNVNALDLSCTEEQPYATFK